ncbi:MAG: site-2 protease family protein [Clostridia bacterium]|nr:site-2 protease family protein [Clostridia bacterium]
MKNIKIKFDFFSVFIFFVSLFIKNKYTSLTILAVTIHEVGHVFAAFIFKIKITELSVGILGARLKTSHSLTSYFQEIMLCLFGPLFNFISFGLILVLYHNNLSNKLLYFATASILLGTLNLMPIKSFDGGRILESILSLFLSPKHTLNTVKLVSFFFVLTLWIISVYFLLIYTSSLGLFVFSAALFCNIFVDENF